MGVIMNDKQRVLIVDDNISNLDVLNELLRPDYNISVATNGIDALKITSLEDPPDLILLDVMMPDIDGYKLCIRLKEEEKTQGIPIIFITSKDNTDDERKGLELGAVDYITKPISPPIVKVRVRNQMELKLHKDRLECLVDKRTKQLRDGYIDTINRLTLASEYKDEDTGAHIKRISFYTKEIAEQLGSSSEFCESIFFASPMHDIGKVSIPDAILLKPGPLDDDEWNILKTHSEIGANILDGSDSPFLQMAVDIAQFHHERWDGTGYPNGSKKEEIPITARIMNIADQYDALRSRRPYKPAFDHLKTTEIIIKGDGRTMPGHFDPEVLLAFEKAISTFADIYESHEDE